jgi:uncharacterized protein YndB with AHSA1/START domain
METLHQSVVINAPREKVYRVMLEDATYREWTAPFNPGGSYYEGDWSEGSTMRFIGPDPKDPTKLGGMLAEVAANRPNEFISLRHYGMIQDGVEDTTSDEVKKWTPAFENYTLRDVDGGTEVAVDVDTNEEYKEMFAEMWPKALAKLKEICER